MAIDFVQLAALSSVCNAGPVVWERLSRLPDVDDSFRENFHARIVESGFHFRSAGSDNGDPRLPGSFAALFRAESEIISRGNSIKA